MSRPNTARGAAHTAARTAHLPVLLVAGLPILLAACTLVLGGCGSEGTPSQQAAASPSKTATSSTSPPTAASSPSPSASSGTQLSRATLQRLLDTARGTGPGAILRVGVPGETHATVFRVASGPFAKGSSRPAKPTDQFRTASITKTFTAVVALRLAEQGALRLDDPIAQYLSPSLVDRLNVIDGVSRGRKITVRHLLTHTSGIYDYAMDQHYIGAVTKHPRKQWTGPEQVEFALSHGRPYGAPGETYGYADTNYVLLAMIIEQVTGQSLADSYRTYILAPLDLKDTYLEGKQEPHGAGVAHAYYGSIDTAGFNPSFDTNGGGGLVSTADDLATFITALLGGKIFADPATLATMLTPTEQSLAAGSGYGCGIEVTERGGVRWVGHSGFFSAFMYCAPGQGIVITGTLDQMALISRVNELVNALEDWLPAQVR